jgi:hypothetical protein
MIGLLRQCTKQENTVCKRMFLISNFIPHKTEILDCMNFLSKCLEVCAKNTGNLLTSHEQNSEQGHDTELSNKSFENCDKSSNIGEQPYKSKLNS